MSKDKVILDKPGADRIADRKKSEHPPKMNKRVVFPNLASKFECIYFSFDYYLVRTTSLDKIDGTN